MYVFLHIRERNCKVGLIDEGPSASCCGSLLYVMNELKVTTAFLE